MVQRYEVVLADDMDGSTKGVTGVAFTFDGVEHRLDLSPKNRAKLEKALQPFIDAASASSTVRAIRSSENKAPKGEVRQAIKRDRSGNTMSAKVRKWADQQGMTVPSRGRLPNDVVKAFDEYEAKHQNVG